MVRILFVDDDKTDQLVLRRMLRLFEREWDMTFVQSGQEALEALSQAGFDAIVSDMQMPGMNGAELLEEVMKRYPGMVRIILSGEVREETTLRSVGSAQVWLPKPCNTDFLKHVIDRCCAWGDLLNSPDLKRLIGQMKSLPSVPHLYMRLVEELKSPDTSFRAVAGIVSSDVGMTAKILQMVNSAFFGFYQSISNLEQAISILGLNMIKALVLSVRVFSQFDPRKMAAFRIESLMSHSTAVGALARMIVRSETKDRKLGDDAFMAGMLHDAGKLVLAHNLPGKYTRVMQLAREKVLPLHVLERDEFGATHGDIGAYLLTLWGLPDPIVEAVAFHHRPAKAPSQAFGALTAVHAANVLEHQKAKGEQALPCEKMDSDYFASLQIADRIAKWSDICHAIARRENETSDQRT